MAILPPIIKDSGPDGIPYFFIVLGGITVFGTLFIMVYMKETKGKTPAEIEEMFS